MDRRMRSNGVPVGPYPAPVRFTSVRISRTRRPSSSALSFAFWKPNCLVSAIASRATTSASVGLTDGGGGCVGDGRGCVRDGRGCEGYWVSYYYSCLRQIWAWLR